MKHKFSESHVKLKMDVEIEISKTLQLLITGTKGVAAIVCLCDWRKCVLCIRQLEYCNNFGRSGGHGFDLRLGYRMTFEGVEVHERSCSLVNSKFARAQ